VSNTNALHIIDYVLSIENASHLSVFQIKMTRD